MRLAYPHKPWNKWPHMEVVCFSTWRSCLVTWRPGRLSTGVPKIQGWVFYFPPIPALSTRSYPAIFVNAVYTHPLLSFPPSDIYVSAHISAWLVIISLWMAAVIPMSRSHHLHTELSDQQPNKTQNIGVVVNKQLSFSLHIFLLYNRRIQTFLSSKATQMVV